MRAHEATSGHAVDPGGRASGGSQAATPNGTVGHGGATPGVPEHRPRAPEGATPGRAHNLGARKGRDAKADVWDRDGLVLAATAYASNADLILAAHRLGHLQEGWLTLDATYGKGVFWRRFRPERLVTNDLYEPGADHRYDFRNLPTSWAGTFDATVFDPPYGLRGTVGADNGGYGLDGGYLSVEDRHGLILEGIRECARVTKPGGRVLLKCQDQVALGRLHFQTFGFAVYAAACGLTLVERLDMLPNTKGGRKQPARTRKARKGEEHDGSGRVPSTQQHARGRPSSLLIFRKEGDRG